MSLLAIIISLILEKLLPAMHGLRSLAWINAFQQVIHTRLAAHEKWQGIPSLLLIVLLPIVAIALVQHLLNDVHILLGFIFSIVVLTYCLGPKDRHQMVHHYLDAQENGDEQNAQDTLKEILDVKEVESLPVDKATLSQQIMEKVLTQTHDQLLAILFWFVVLGPMGALLFRLSFELLQIRQQTESEEENSLVFAAAVDRLYYVLAWIPCRLTALSYAVMGSFTHSLHAWQDTPLEEDGEDKTHTQQITQPKSHRLLIRIGMASLQLGTVQQQDEQQDETKQNEAIRETLGLCGRSLIVWITILAIMTLAGWAS